MKAPVILDPFVSAAFFGVLSSALTADAVQKNRSLFAGREGERVAGELLELVDDGTLDDGLESAPFDGEGVPSGRTPLIAGGVLQGFLYDTYTARKAGRSSTGNGIRGGYSGLPGVRPTNLVVTGPATPLARSSPARSAASSSPTRSASTRAPTPSRASSPSASAAC